MFAAELSITEKNEKKKSSGEWINELQYLSTTEYYIVPYIFRNKFQKHVY